MTKKFNNPFRPGAGQQPPYLAGREREMKAFEKLLGQSIVFQNMILTGLRGTGKTVLSEAFTPAALRNGWFWVGTDLSESASVSEENLVVRLLTDLAVVTSQIVISKEQSFGFSSGDKTGGDISLDYNILNRYFESRPGLVSDRLKSTLEWIWGFVKASSQGVKGIVFAYDEAQNMDDHPKEGKYPLSVLLDVFQSLQRKEIPFLLLLVGLPTLFPKLVDARTYTERMFEIVELKSLSVEESRDAIIKPIEIGKCPVNFSEDLIGQIVEQSGGYPYFIQFICREVYDIYLSQLSRGIDDKTISIRQIIEKLDTVFFAGRWSNTTDRQRELLAVVALLPNHSKEFTIQEVIAKAKTVLKNPISQSHMNQMFVTLTDVGLMHKTRHGKYSLGIPLLGEFIKRQRIL